MVASHRVGTVMLPVALAAVTLSACRSGPGQTPLPLGLAELAPVGGSGLSATAGFAFHGDRLSSVEVNIQTGTVGSGLDARIVGGTCGAPGRLVADIGALEGPQLFADVPVGRSDLIDVVVVLTALGSETPLACGAIRPTD